MFTVSSTAAQLMTAVDCRERLNSVYRKRCILMEVKLYARRNAGKSQNRRHFGRILSPEFKDMIQTLSSTVKKMDSKSHSSFTKFFNNLDENTTLVPSIQQLKHFALFTCLQNTSLEVYCNITPFDGFFPGFPSSLQKEWLLAPLKEWSFYFKFNSWNRIDYTDHSVLEN